MFHASNLLTVIFIRAEGLIPVVLLPPRLAVVPRSTNNYLGIRLARSLK